VYFEDFCIAFDLDLEFVDIVFFGFVNCRQACLGVLEHEQTDEKMNI
jgi:hypothetical protein